MINNKIIKDINEKFEIGDLDGAFESLEQILNFLGIDPNAINQGKDWFNLLFSLFSKGIEEAKKLANAQIDKAILESPIKKGIDNLYNLKHLATTKEEKDLIEIRIQEYMEFLQ